MTLAFVLGSPLHEQKREDGSVNRGDTRLLRIVVSETAYLIWKLRCERVIEWEQDPTRTHSAAELENKWAATINARLSFDQTRTNMKSPNTRLLAAATVRATWQGTLRGEQELPEDWAERRIRVLVGKPSVRPNG
ncbi:hypothetical protein C8Q70DRAFT_926035 [Cubamyces menziesii]|nr:hypothetical protein C8Q70DRAFT_926035 [Cubamyces menziesii]